MQFHEMAEYLSRQGVGHIVVPDLRGHGFSPDRRGDVDHIGQFEDDIADLIVYARAEHTDGAQIILGGHSSGGGLVVRFAGGKYEKLADGFVLMAPFLKYDAPTTRPSSGGWANVATRRLIGLSMLNQIGITALNHLPVISFNMPKSVLDGPFGKTATLQYSYRLNTGFAPRTDYTSDLAAMSQPFLLLSGSNDESFYSDRYEGLISQYARSGTYRLLEGVNHIGLVNAPAAFDAIFKWVRETDFK
jgi:pimeloyl-ACP methyl ester carboxylesterase